MNLWNALSWPTVLILSIAIIFLIKSPEAYFPGHNHYSLTLAIYVWLTFLLI